MDERSILWLNQFVLDLKQSLNQFMAVYKLNDNSKSDEHVDIRVDGLMLKVPYKQVAVRIKPFLQKKSYQHCHFQDLRWVLKYKSTSLHS